MWEKMKELMAGLHGKILAISVLPAVLLGMANLIGNGQVNSVVSESRESVTALQARNAKVEDAVSELRQSMAQAIRQASAVSRVHQTALMTQNADMTSQTRSEISELKAVIGRLSSNSETMMTLLDREGFVSKDPAVTLTDGKAAGSLPLDARRAFAVVMRLARSMERRLEMFTEANDRTIALMGAGDFDGASTNFRFEEAPRLNALEGALGKMDETATDLMAAVNVNLTKARNAMQGAAEDQISDVFTINLIILLAGIGLVIVIVCLFVARMVVNPINRQVAVMDTLATGDTNVDIPQPRDATLSRIADGLKAFRDGLEEQARLRAEQKRKEEEEQQRKEEEERRERERMEEKAREERKQAERTARRQKMLEKAINSFEGSVADVLAALTQSSADLKSASSKMTEIAGDSEAKSSEVAAAAEQAASNVQSVAAASEEMSASIQEISRQVSRSAEMTRDATTKAQSTNSLVQELASNVTKIDDVVQLINDIAEQTNLLALNATIEAARAGDAGRGFAVVASEVKNLATQTAKATEDIRSQITTVQKMGLDASKDMEVMLKVFEETNEIAGTIASAVEEQNSSTSEISQSAGEAASSTDTVTSNIQGLKDGVQENRSASEDVDQASDILSSKSDELKTVVQSFLKDIDEAQSHGREDDENATGGPAAAE
ncbi:methyl-accepting chemotaxis protein [Yunchengibacter salinarum]|uniref:methyl-accepting chemotaxis protein n=1 Tax=Yunchengibacter salinarum TaxID=3133399 RepID=UPI0035B61593